MEHPFHRLTWARCSVCYSPGALPLQPCCCYCLQQRCLLLLQPCYCCYCLLQPCYPRLPPPTNAQTVPAVSHLYCCHWMYCWLLYCHQYCPLYCNQVYGRLCWDPAGVSPSAPQCTWVGWRDHTAMRGCRSPQGRSWMAHSCPEKAHIRAEYVLVADGKACMQLTSIA